MDIGAAQKEMSCGFVGGAPGVLVSGITWLMAGFVQRMHGDQLAFLTLFAGGMLIVPLSLLIVRLLFRADKVPADNPLQRLGFESTIMLFAGLLIAFALLEEAPGLAFPALAMAIGARYFVFRSLYGDAFYWVLGAFLILIATVGMLAPRLLPFGPLLMVGIAECVFAAILLARWKRRMAAGPV